MIESRPTVKEFDESDATAPSPMDFPLFPISNVWKTEATILDPLYVVIPTLSVMLELNV